MTTRLVNDVLDLTSPASFPNTIKQSLKTALSNHIINEVDIPLAAMTGVGVYKAALNENIHPEQIYRAVQAGIKAIPQAKRTGDAFSTDPKRKAFVTGQQIALAAVNNLPVMQKETRDTLKNQIHRAITSFTYATAPETYSTASLKGGEWYKPWTWDVDWKGILKRGVSGMVDTATNPHGMSNEDRARLITQYRNQHTSTSINGNTVTITPQPLSFGDIMSMATGVPDPNVIPDPHLMPKPGDPAPDFRWGSFSYNMTGANNTNSTETGIPNFTNTATGIPNFTNTATGTTSQPNVGIDFGERSPFGVPGTTAYTDIWGSNKQDNSTSTSASTSTDGSESIFSRIFSKLKKSKDSPLISDEEMGGLKDAYLEMFQNLPHDIAGMSEYSRIPRDERSLPTELLPKSIALFQEAQKSTGTSFVGGLAQIAAASLPFWLPDAINAVKRWKKGRDLTEEEENHTDKVSGLINAVAATAIPLYRQRKLQKTKELTVKAAAQMKKDLNDLEKKTKLLEYDMEKGKVSNDARARISKPFEIIKSYLDPELYPYETPLDLYGSVKPLADAYRTGALEARAKEREKKKAKTEEGRRLVQEMMAREKAHEEEVRQRASITNISPAGQARMIYKEGIDPRANYFTIRRPIAGIRRVRPLETLEEEIIDNAALPSSKPRRKKARKIKGGAFEEISKYTDRMREANKKRKELMWTIGKEAGALALEALIGTVLGSPALGVAAVAKHLAPTAMALIDKQTSEAKQAAKEASQRELQEKIRQEMLELKQNGKLLDFAKNLAKKIASSDGETSESEQAIYDVLAHVATLIQQKQEDKALKELEAQVSQNMAQILHK